jgi:type I restriction enzyme R subunit
VNPAYNDKMSKWLDAPIAQRSKGVLNYREYLEKTANLAKQATTPGGDG